MLAFGVAEDILAPLAATMIQLAMSRKREFSADGPAAWFPPYPNGLGSAWRKSPSDPIPLRPPKDPPALLYTATPSRGKKKNWSPKLSLPPPPVEDRIRALTEMSI